MKAPNSLLANISGCRVVKYTIKMCEIVDNSLFRFWVCSLQNQLNNLSWQIWNISCRPRKKNSNSMYYIDWQLCDHDSRIFTHYCLREDLLRITQDLITIFWYIGRPLMININLNLWHDATTLYFHQMLEHIDWGVFGFDGRNGTSSTFWLGSKGAYTPCHYDTYGCNLVAQLFGR